MKGDALRAVGGGREDDQVEERVCLHRISAEGDEGVSPVPQRGGVTVAEVPAVVAKVPAREDVVATLDDGYGQEDVHVRGTYHHEAAWAGC